MTQVASDEARTTVRDPQRAAWSLREWWRSGWGSPIAGVWPRNMTYARLGRRLLFVCAVYVAWLVFGAVAWHAGSAKMQNYGAMSFVVLALPAFLFTFWFALHRQWRDDLRRIEGRLADLRTQALKTELVALDEEAVSRIWDVSEHTDRARQAAQRDFCRLLDALVYEHAPLWSDAAAAILDLEAGATLGERVALANDLLESLAVSGRCAYYYWGSECTSAPEEADAYAKQRRAAMAAFATTQLRFRHFMAHLWTAPERLHKVVTDADFELPMGDWRFEGLRVVPPEGALGFG